MGYAALAAAWNASPTPPTGVSGSSLTGLTTAQKIAAVNAWTVAGPPQDVTAQAIINYLFLNMKYSNLQAYASNPPAGSVANFPQSVATAKELLALFTTPSFSGFQMSNPTIYTAAEAFLGALAADSATGISSTDAANLLALSATTIPWWQSIGLTSPVSAPDLMAAGGLI